MRHKDSFKLNYGRHGETIMTPCSFPLKSSNDERND